MAHRSDEEALRAKLEERERELVDAQKALDAAKGENARLRAGRPSPLVEMVQRFSGGRGFGGPALVIGLFAVLTVGLGAAFFVLRSQPMAAYPSMPPAPPPPPYFVPAPPVAPPPPATLSVRFGARVTNVTGDSMLRVDDPCTITATIWPTPPTPTVSEVELACGATRLYSSATPAFGVSMTSSGSFVWPDATPGMVRYELTYSDTGTRSGSPEMVLNSWTGEGAVFTSGLGAYHVDLDVDPVSDPVAAPPGTPYIPGLPPHVVRHGHVVSAVPAGLAEGTRCRVAVRPSPGEPSLNTRSHIRCGAVTLYGVGTTGRAPRVGDVITDTGVTSEDADPAIALDLAAGTLSIRDVRNGVEERIEIVLDPEAPAATPPDPASAAPAAVAPSPAPVAPAPAAPAP